MSSTEGAGSGRSTRRVKDDDEISLGEDWPASHGPAFDDYDTTASTNGSSNAHSMAGMPTANDPDPEWSESGETLTDNGGSQDGDRDSTPDTVADEGTGYTSASAEGGPVRLESFPPVGSTEYGTGRAPSMSPAPDDSRSDSGMSSMSMYSTSSYTYSSDEHMDSNSDHEARQAGGDFGANGPVEADGSRHSPPTETNNILPCEFAFTSCRHAFPLGYEKVWARHHEGHLKGRFPSHCHCWFCGKSFYEEEKGRKREANFERRMLHIGEHYRRGDANRLRACCDLTLLRHLYRNKVISKDAYSMQEQYEQAYKQHDSIVYGAMGSYSYEDAGHAGDGRYGDSSSYLYDETYANNGSYGGGESYGGDGIFSDNGSYGGNEGYDGDGSYGKYGGNGGYVGSGSYGGSDSYSEVEVDDIEAVSKLAIDKGSVEGDDGGDHHRTRDDDKKRSDKKGDKKGDNKSDKKDSKKDSKKKDSRKK